MNDLIYKIILAIVILIVLAIFAYFVGYDREFERAVPQPGVQPTASPTAFPSTSLTPVPSEADFSISPNDDPVFCTQDALACPDGSFVGRVPPSCDFASCPGT